MRPSGRRADELRKVTIETGFTRHAEGSVLIRFGDTHVLCTASIDAKTPPWLRNSGLGWVTAEYGMLPRATNTRNRREAKNGQTGRTQEIQRLIGRALRAGTDRVVMGERQIMIDCDVLQADGGTRTAAITGGWVALWLATEKLVAAKECTENPISQHIAAISCGVHNGQVVLDLDYAEDSEAGTDRVVMGERQIMIDCDVLQADGGTRTAAITGGWVALWLAAEKLVAAKECIENPISQHIAAISCGVHNGQVVLDLDYAEDSEAGTDANFVLTGDGGMVEVQASAEGATFSETEFHEMLTLAKKGISELVVAQKAAQKAAQNATLG
jgi:ribonuclease PH